MELCDYVHVLSRLIDSAVKTVEVQVKNLVIDLQVHVAGWKLVLEGLQARCRDS